ncbi:STAS domain-containing protein [Skermania sp. ID1734]|uniref:STAS domain-containing protein n=1 Tax=Skermania sp. ID1734 TaxID=2597516 RepID=UPI00163DDC90|nr:STAS domain-containing protein [Skermania sp. ID1734]
MATVDAGIDGSDSALQITTEFRRTVTVLTVTGDLDLLTAPRLSAALHASLHRDSASVIVDLTGLHFLASVGITALLDAAERIRLRGGSHTRLAVVALGQVSRRPLQLTGVDAELDVYSTLPEALEVLENLDCGDRTARREDPRDTAAGCPAV